MKGTVGLKGQKARSQQFIMAEYTARCCGRRCTFANGKRSFSTRSCTRNRPYWTPLSERYLFPRRPLALSLGNKPAMDEMTGVIRNMSNWKAAGPDSLPATESRTPRIHPVFSQHAYERVENGKSSPAMGGCDHQGPSLKEGSFWLQQLKGDFARCPRRHKCC